MCPGGPMALRRYGELSARAGDNGSDPPRASNGGACVAPGTAVTSTCWLPRSRGRRTREGAAGRSRAVLALGDEEPAGGWNVTGDCAHGARGSRGGARIVCARAKV